MIGKITVLSLRTNQRSTEWQVSTSLGLAQDWHLKNESFVYLLEVIWGA